MHWLYLVVAIVFVAVGSLAKTPNWLSVILVLGSLGLLIGWILGWMSQRVSGASRDDVQMISPEEMRLMREQAEARKAAAAAAEMPPPMAPAEPDEPIG